MTKIVDSDKYIYFGYNIAYDACEFLIMSDSGRIGKNVIISGADMSWFEDIDNKKNDVLFPS